MKAILTLALAVSALMLASCASTKADDCASCSKPGAKSACCASDTKKM